MKAVTRLPVELGGAQGSCWPMALPAFGALTGGARIEREPADRVIALAEGRLYEILALRSAA